MWGALVITALTAYLLGNLNGAICMSTLLEKDDVRNHGSGNAGMTNFLRSYGGWKTLLVILIDMGKTVLACLVGRYMLDHYGFGLEGAMLAAVAVSLGHDFPALLGFRGGKGILSGLFIALAIDWRVGVLALSVFVLIYLLTRYVSLGSILGSTAFAVGFGVFQYGNWIVMGLGIFMGLLAVAMHWQNILRLVKGQEKKTDLFKKSEKQ